MYAVYAPNRAAPLAQGTVMMVLGNTLVVHVRLPVLVVIYML